MKFVVVGGGTAGWLTALYVKKHVPYSDVTVIASSEIGILGAGEGTNWDFLEFLKDIDIPVKEIIKHARGTFKNGIKFTNWNGDGDYYYHPFLDHLGKNPAECSSFDSTPFYLNKIVQGKTVSSLQLTNLISERNQVKYKLNKKDTVGISALHFDAHLLADYLQSVGLTRNINLIDDEVVDIITNSKGDITEFNLKSGKIIETDFVFDCSGFKRLIIGNFYKSNWTSYQDSLPVNRAMPFFIDNPTNNISPYTEAIAMKYGWLWKIPVQGRYGCGYVFDSRLVSDEKIKQELTEFLGYEPSLPRIFDFEPGTYDRTWINNCVAIGLSSGFVEPLEATSIQVSTFALRSLSIKIQGFLTNRKRAIEEFNYEIRTINEHVLNFLHFHYLSKRSDTVFWKDFAQNTTPKFVKMVQEINKKTFLKEQEFEYLTLVSATEHPVKNPFSVFSWQQVAAGIGYFKQSVADRELDSYKNFNMDIAEADLMAMLEDIGKDLYNHYDYIEYLKRL